MVQYVIYGDGLGAQIQSKRVFQDREKGVMKVEYVLLPTYELAEKYNLFSKLDKNGFIKVVHLLVDRVVLSDDPYLGRELILKTFINGDTVISNLYAKYREQILGMEKVISALRNQNAWLHERLRLLGSRRKEMIKQDIELYSLPLKLRKHEDEKTKEKEEME